MKNIQTETNNLTAKQRRIIPFLVSARSVEEARKAAGVSQETVWRWMKNPLFRDELEAARQSVIDEALANLKSSITQAVQTLTDAMAEGEPALRVRAAGMILDHFWKVKELQELEIRLKRIEDILAADGRVTN